MKKTVLERVKYWAVLNFGLLILSGSIYFFKVPNGFATGGVSGLALLLSRAVGIMTQAQYTAVLNGALLILGLIFLGKGCGGMTIVCTVIYTVEMSILEALVPMNGPLTDQTFLELAYAILLGGIGSAILFECNASSGGTDIVAMIISFKKPGIRVGRALLISDFIIVIATGFLLGLRSGITSLIGLILKGTLIDAIMKRLECKYRKEN